MEISRGGSLSLKGYTVKSWLTGVLGSGSLRKLYDFLNEQWVMEGRFCFKGIWLNIYIRLLRYFLESRWGLGVTRSLLGYVFFFFFSGAFDGLSFEDHILTFGILCCGGWKWMETKATETIYPGRKIIENLLWFFSLCLVKTKREQKCTVRDSIS